MFRASDFNNHARPSDTPDRLARALSMAQDGLKTNRQKVRAISSPVATNTATKKKFAKSELVARVVRDERFRNAVAIIARDAIQRRKDLVRMATAPKAVH